MRCEIPSDPMWCGKEIPVFRGKSIFRFFAARFGRAGIDLKEEAKFYFDLTDDDYNYWLAQWKHLIR